MAIRHDQGIVLRSYPFGEADRVVVLLSPNRGKLRTVAKGVRKTKSRFGGRLEPFTHVDLVLYEGRNLDELEKVVGVDLPDEEWDTVGGLVLGLAERVPEVGEVFQLETVAFRVERMQGRRVSVVGVTVEPPVAVT